MARYESPNIWPEHLYDVTRSAQDDVTRPGNRYIPLWISDAHKYERGALNLHIHGTIGDTFDYCIVLNCATRPHGAACAIGHVPMDNGLVHSEGHHRQVLVAVCIRESPEDEEGIDTLRVLVTIVVRLQALKDCDGVRMHLLDRGLPPAARFSSLRVLSWNARLPYALKIDREAHLGTTLRRHKPYCKVIQPGMDVIDEIASYEASGYVGMPSSMQPPDWALLLALSDEAHCVWTLTREFGEDRLEVDEVLLCPVEFQVEGRLSSSHGLDLNPGEREYERRASDAADPDRLHDPGADPR